MGWRHRHGQRGRNPKPINIEKPLNNTNFTPNKQTNQPPILLELAEIEAQRLVDLEGLSQEEAGIKMGVSRGTVWRLLQSARKKTIQALTEGRMLQIDFHQDGDE
jgi:Predicted DNA-binding proteins